MLDKFLNQPVDVEKYRVDFEAMGVDSTGRVNGSQAKVDLVKSKLPSAVLHRIWNLADITRDGYLDLYEYALARHFIEMKLEGFELPASLPDRLLPSYEGATIGGGGGAGGSDAAVGGERGGASSSCSWGGGESTASIDVPSEGRIGITTASSSSILNHHHSNHTADPGLWAASTGAMRPSSLIG
ncbi:sarcalumenin eps15 family protein, partial [Cystoisospora suis]